MAELPAAAHSPLSSWGRRPGARTGEGGVHTMRSSHLRNWRRVWTYAPAGHETMTDLPVLVLLDGEVWGPGLGVATLLDNLIADGVLPPLVALMPDSLDNDTRWDELTCDDAFVDFLTGELLPGPPAAGRSAPTRPAPFWPARASAAWPPPTRHCAAPTASATYWPSPVPSGGPPPPPTRHAARSG